MREQERTLFEAPRLVGAALPLAPERDGGARVRVPVVAQVEAVLRAREEHPADHSGAEEEVSDLNVIVTYPGEVRGGEGGRRDSPEDVRVAVVGLDLPLARPRGRDDGRTVAGLAVKGDVEARRGVLEVVVPVRLLQDPLYACVSQSGHQCKTETQEL